MVIDESGETKKENEKIEIFSPVKQAFIPDPVASVSSEVREIKQQS